MSYLISLSDADELAKNTFSSTRKDVASITSTFPLEIREIIWKAAYVEDKPIKFGRASAPLSLAFIDRTRYLGHKIVSKSTSQEVAKIFYRDNIFKLPIIDDLRSFGVRDQFDPAVTPSTLVERLILKFQYSESRGPPPDNAKYMAMFECQTGAGIDWFEAGTRMEHHLEPLHDFVALKEITIRIRRGRYTTWDPRGFVNPIMHLKERGINVKVLLCQDIVSINERIIAGQDVSSCFDFPSEEEKVQLQHLLRCSHKDDPRPGSHVPIQVFTNEQRRRGQGTFRFPCFGGCDRTFTNRGCPNDWDPWKFGFYRALVHEYRNLYLEYVFKNDVECEFCGEEAEEGIDLFKKGKEPHSLRVVLDDRRNELDYDDEEFPLHAAHCRCLRECRYPEGEPEDMEWEGNESEDSIWS